MKASYACYCEALSAEVPFLKTFHALFFKSLVGLGCFLVLVAKGPAQVTDSATSDSLSTAIEDEPSGSDRYFEMVQSESDKLTLLDDLLWRQEHPYDLNSMTRAEMESIPGVTPYEVAELIRFRKMVKSFTSIDQLKELGDIGELLHEKLSPYVTVKRQAPRTQLRLRTSRDLQPRRGYMDSTFLGPSFKSYGRLSVEAVDFQMGAVTEKDAGERFANGFVSGYVSMMNMGAISGVVVGDFNVEAGQGLVFWRASSFGKGCEAVSIAKKSGLGVQPCRSTDEFNYFRGAAASASLGTAGGKVNVTAFLSRRVLDGSLDSAQQVTSFYDSGLFQTQNDLGKRKAVSEQLVGGRIEWVGTSGLRFGSTAYHTKFDKEIFSERAYEFKGVTQDVVGLDAAVTAGRISAFGEFAGSRDRAVAGIVGTILNIGARSNVVLVYRDYGAAYDNFHASGFGEHSNVKNEQGFYVGAEIQTLKWLRLSGYVDQFRFPWRTYFDPLPTIGHEVFLQTDAAVSPKLDLGARFSHKSTEGAEPNVDTYGRKTRTMVNRLQEKYRLTASYRVSSQLSVKGRLEFTDVGYSPSGRNEKGYLLYQDIRCGTSGRFSVEGRLVFFQTDSYDSRLYEYENDIRGVFSNPGLYGKGRRWYVMTRYSMDDKVTWSAKYSEMQKEGVTSMGSGPSEILGDVDNRLTLQVDLRL